MSHAARAGRVIVGPADAESPGTGPGLDSAGLAPVHAQRVGCRGVGIGRQRGLSGTGGRGGTSGTGVSRPTGGGGPAPADAGSGWGGGGGPADSGLPASRRPARRHRRRTSPRRHRPRPTPAAPTPATAPPPPPVPGPASCGWAWSRSSQSVFIKLGDGATVVPPACATPSSSRAGRCWCGFTSGPTPASPPARCAAVLTCRIRWPRPPRPTPRSRRPRCCRGRVRPREAGDDVQLPGAGDGGEARRPAGGGGLRGRRGHGPRPDDAPALPRRPAPPIWACGPGAWCWT